MTLTSVIAVWLYFSLCFHTKKPAVVIPIVPSTADQVTHQTTTQSAVAPSNMPLQTADNKVRELSALTIVEIQNLTADVLIQSAKNAEEVFEYSESWYPNGVRSGCVREDSAWSFCEFAGASQRALADPRKLSDTLRTHHKTVLRFAKTYCSAYPKINARHINDLAFDYRTRPIVQEPFDLSLTELLNISVATPIQERQAQAMLAKAFQQSYCLRRSMNEVFIRLESVGYRKHLSFASLIDELSSNEVVAAGTLAAELAACRNGPACGPMGFMTMQVCQGLKNCKPAQTLFDIRRERTTPRVFQTAVEIANHYGAEAQTAQK